MTLSISDIDPSTLFNQNRCYEIALDIIFGLYYLKHNTLLYQNLTSNQTLSSFNPNDQIKFIIKSKLIFPELNPLRFELSNLLNT